MSFRSFAGGSHCTWKNLCNSRKRIAQASMIRSRPQLLLHPAFSSPTHRKGWIAVKSFNLSYYVGETILITIFTHYGNCAKAWACLASAPARMAHESTRATRRPRRLIADRLSRSCCLHLDLSALVFDLSYSLNSLKGAI